MLYPLKFKPNYKDYVWGGRNMTALGKLLPAQGSAAESWEISCHPNGPSIIANGEYVGLTLPDMIDRFGRELLGDALPQKDVDKFPLLVKFIDADNNLSVQVHPDDAYANLHENGEYGKNEMWCIVQAAPGATLVYDVVSGTTRQSFAEAVAEGRVEECLKTIPVSAGDFINIPTGVVHAIGKGIILAEVQQNSDTTYRVYDYGRVGRALHIEKALDVIDFAADGRKEKYAGLELFPESQQSGNHSAEAPSSRRIVIANNYFCIEHDQIEGALEEMADGSRFFLYTFTTGSGTLSWQGGEMSVSMGESVFIPASLGRYSLSGSLVALKTYVPDLETNVVGPLKKSGWTMDEILREVGGLAESLTGLQGSKSDRAL